ncbi:hypothetical protein ACJMK2_007786 [Sinanodonta woodiana]|uniref:Eukaryotic translation initiation factor 4 gamma 3 n=1 Tax=Sinanodonta woodiana TaxID=1069815 RepID=A0ABD3VK08_SINWO
MAASQPECGICMNSIKNPKVISCHHSFCNSCLEDYLRVNLRNGRFDCPICRTNVELASVPGLEANVYVNTDFAVKERNSRNRERNCFSLVTEDCLKPSNTYAHILFNYILSALERLQSSLYLIHNLLNEIQNFKEYIKTKTCNMYRWARNNHKNLVNHSSPLKKEDIELHHAKDPWKPKCLAARIDHGEVDIRSDELCKRVRGILNKLTPQTFQILVARMQSLKIDTETCLRNVIDIVFETFKVPADSKQGVVNFRALLLTRCQREFEKAISSEKEFDSKRKEIEKATMEKEKQEMIENLEYEEKKVKKRSSGNIRFIGELFKLKILTENVMHDCVFKLLQTKDEDNIECLCILLKTTGKELDTDKAKRRMDQYFAQMQKIVNEKKLSSRVRFMLQDVIELRQVKWVPRRDDNNPKTIDQIHQEVAQEAKDRAIFVQTLQQVKPQKGSHGSSPRQPMGDEASEADGSNIVSHASFGTDQSIDPTKLNNKLKFTKGGNSAPKSPTASMAIPKIEERLNDLITNKFCSNEEVFDWIEEEVDELTIKQEYFIRALMTAVCKSAVIVSSNNLMKVDKSQIQRRMNLLEKYLDHQANFELQALFALQALVHKMEHPPGVLRELFDILYDEDIISEDAFIQWEKSEDPQEQEGKGVAMKQVVQFFTWLKEAEDDAES